MHDDPDWQPEHVVLLHPAVVQVWLPVQTSQMPSLLRHATLDVAGTQEGVLFDMVQQVPVAHVGKFAQV